MANSYLDKNGVAYLWEKIKSLASGKVDKVDGKGLSSNDYTSDEKTKLANIAAGAQVNVLEGIQKNGTTVTVTNKIANISVPTKTSDITNDSGFITIADVPEGSTASTTVPQMDGTAAVGTETAFARGDHVHPHDTSKADKATTLSGYGITDAYTKTEIDQKLIGAMTYKGTVATTSALPATGNATGDMYHVTADGSEWAWNGTKWEELGSEIDLSGYMLKTDMVAITNAEIDTIAV